MGDVCFVLADCYAYGPTGIEMIVYNCKVSDDDVTVVNDCA